MRFQYASDLHIELSANSRFLVRPFPGFFGFEAPNDREKTIQKQKDRTMKHVFFIVVFLCLTAFQYAQEASAQTAVPQENAAPESLMRPFSFYAPPSPFASLSLTRKPKLSLNLHDWDEWCETPGRYNFATGKTDPLYPKGSRLDQTGWRNVETFPEIEYPNLIGPIGGILQGILNKY